MSGRAGAGEMRIGQAPGDLATLQAFVNTLDIEQSTDELDSPAALDRWLASAGLSADAADGLGRADASTSGPAGSQQLFLALELREALRGILGSHVAHDAAGAQATTFPPDRGLPEPVRPDPVRRLRVIAAALPAQLEVSPDGHVAAAPAGFGAVAGLARLMLIAAEAATLGTWSRLKVCSASDCQWAFYDRSPTQNGCWCSMQICGSRAKARAYRKRAASSRPRASRSARTATRGA